MKWTPSIVTLRRDGTLAFGQEAKENFDEQRSIRSIKRVLGTPERVPLVGKNLRTEQVAVMLFSLLKKDAEQSLGEPFTKAVVTIPANSKGLARKAELVPERHLSLEEEVDRATLERAIMPLVVKSGTAIDEALRLRGLRPRDIDKVLLVGGTSKIPLVRRFVTERLGGKEPEPFEKVDPMTCVAQGAAIVSAILQNAAGLDNYAYSVKLEHSLCANPVDQRTNRVFLDPIIKRGADIPCSFTKTYYPVADPADRVLISVYEGDIYDNPESPENVKLAEIPWEFKPARPQRDGALEVMFEYGDDGILTVMINDVYAGQKKRFAIQQTGENELTAAQIMKMKEINKSLINQTLELESTQEYKDAIEVLKKTEQDVIPRIENAE